MVERRASAAACSMHHRGSSNARRSPYRSTSDSTVTPGPGRAASCPATSGSASPTMTTTGRPAGGGEVADAADDLAVEALGVEVALAGDDDVGVADPLVELDVLGDEVEPADEASAEGGQPAGQPAGRTGAVELGHIDAVLDGVAPGELFQPRRQQGDLGGPWHPSAARTRRRRRRSGCARRTPPARRRRATWPGCAGPRPHRARHPSSPSRRGRRRSIGPRPRAPGRAAARCRSSRRAAGRCPRRRRRAPARSPGPSRSPRCADRAARPPPPGCRADR